MKRFSQLVIPYIAWAVMMLILPMGLIALYSFTKQGNTIVSFTFTLEHYAKFFTDPDFLIVLWRSLLIAFKTTVIASTRMFCSFSLLLEIKNATG